MSGVVIPELVGGRKPLIRNYQASLTLRRFHHDDTFFRSMMGCVGSGKTVGVGVAEMLARAVRQRPHNGVRYSRWAVIRNTYSQLKDTTIKTWRDWVPASVCLMKDAAPVRGLIDQVPIEIFGELDPDGGEVEGVELVDGFPLGDGTTLHLEVLFLALDRIQDISKLLSLELTGAFVNEVVQVPKEVVTMLFKRVGRYPSMMMGGASWWGVTADTNPPPVGHWYYELAEEEKPENMVFYRQPGALIRVEEDRYEPNPLAENIGNLPGATPENPDGGYQYYYQQLAGATKDEISVYVLGEYGQVFTGRPVYEDHWRDSFHVSPTPLGLYRGLPLRLAWDFGMTPSCTLSQLTPNGRLNVLRGIDYERGGIRQFATGVIKPMLANDFGQLVLAMGVADPAGDTKAQEEEKTCIGILNDEGLPTKKASSNDFVIRRQGVIDVLNRVVDGGPALLLDPVGCKRLRQGFNGGYQFSRMRVVGANSFKLEPDKNEFSHGQDALQYECLDISLPQVAPRRGGVPGVPQKSPWRRRGGRGRF